MMYPAIACAVVTMLASGCIDTNAPQTFNLTPAGGELSLAGGAVVFSVPPNAVTTSIAVTATPVTNIAGLTVVSGTVYDIQSLVHLNLPIRVTIQFAAAALPPGVLDSELVIYKYNGSTWFKLDGSVVSPTFGTVAADLTSFGVFGVLGAPATNVVVTPLLPPCASINC